MSRAVEVLGTPHRRQSAAWGLYPGRSDRRVQATSASIALRRFSGPMADELFLHCRPDEAISDPARQAEALYEALLDALASEGAGPEAIVSETVFFRRIREHCEMARRARSRVLRAAGHEARRVATTLIGQPPVDRHAQLELSAVAVIPRSDRSYSAHAASPHFACSCEACAPGAHARVVRLGDQTSLVTGNIYGSGADAFEEAYDMFRVAEGLLADAWMSFGNVVRTWIYVRDIDRHYGALNEARREFFQRCAIERRPASTCVQGIPSPGAHDFSMSLHATTSLRGLDIEPIHTPLLNEAWTYGADFSRGLRIAEANKVTLHVSGTASIDEAGRTVHVGHFEAQVDRMLDNIASLLARQGASFDDLVSGVTYLKNPSDGPALRAMFRQRGFDRFPCAIVEAPLCRPDLLCETEAVALLPAATVRA